MEDKDVSSDDLVAKDASSGDIYAEVDMLLATDLKFNIKIEL